MLRTYTRTFIAIVSASILAMTTAQVFAEEVIDPEARTEAANAKSQASQAQSNAAQAQQAASNVAGGLVALEARVATLEVQNAALLARLEALEANTVLALNGVLSFDETGEYPKAVFEGVNVQIVNGTGWTLPDPISRNSLGNLIIGYDEVRTSGEHSCSQPFYTTQETCESNGYTWARSHKTGDHNLIVGPYHNYSSLAGVVFGNTNTVSGNSGSVLGGQSNTPSGHQSSVVGGLGNKAKGGNSVITGGDSNTVARRGSYSTINGGSENHVEARQATIGGGLGCSFTPANEAGSWGVGAPYHLGDC